MQLTNTRDIRAQIANISKTRKITKAMQQISFAKLAQARKRAEAIRPYGRILRGMMARLVRVDPDYQPALMARRVPAHRIGMIVVTTDKGLCGPLNTRLLQQVVAQLASWEQARREVLLTVVGLRGLSTLGRAGFKVVAHVPCGCEFQHSEELLGTMSVPIMQFLKGEIDELYVATNRFVNTLNYEPIVSRFLPLDERLVGVPAYLQPPAMARAEYAPVDYVYEPGEQEGAEEQAEDQGRGGATRRWSDVGRDRGLFSVAGHDHPRSPHRGGETRWGRRPLSPRRRVTPRGTGRRAT